MINIKGNTYYLPGHVNIGIYVQQDEAVVIDTGLDESSARKILKALKNMQIIPKVIINTHSHADHFGGNAFIQKRQDVIVGASEPESLIIKYPIFEPFYLFTASPIKEMKNKFFMAPQSNVDKLLETGKTNIRGFDLEIIPLPGHSIGQIGVVTQDNILFCADAVLGEDVIDKYKLPYIYDVKQHIETLEYLRDTDFDGYVLAHGEYVEDISSAVDANLMVMKKIEEYLFSILSKPMIREEILSQFAQDNQIDINVIQHPLLLSSISAYLAYMANEDMIKYYFENGKMYWHTNSNG